MRNFITKLHIPPVRWTGMSINVLALLLLTSLFFSPAAFAQLPKLSNIIKTDKQGGDSEEKTVSPEQQLAITKIALTQAQAEQSLAAVAGNSRQDLKDKYRLLDGLVTRLNSQLSLIAEREELRTARTVAEQKAKSWAGFPEPPPYSILKVDEITGSVQAARAMARGLNTNLELLARQVSQYREAAKQAQEMERKAVDLLDRAKTPEERSTATLQKELTGLQTRNADAMSALIALRYEVLGERCGIAKVELELLERQLAEAGKRMVFNRADLDKALALLKVSLLGLEQELEASLARDARSRSAQVLSQRALETFALSNAKGESSATTVAQREVLEAQNRAALAWVESSRFESEVVSALVAINKSEATAWEQRFIAVTGTDTKKRHSILAEFSKSRERLKPWLESAKLQLEMYRTAEHEQEARLTKISELTPLRVAESNLLAAKLFQRELAERQIAAIEQADSERVSWLEDGERVQKSRSLSDRGRDWIAAFPTILRSVWRFELFSIEDSVEVAGQKVVTSRGVTVGKSVGALILFLLGYSIAAFIGRRVQQVLIARFDISSHQANVIRRWLMALTIFTLFIITLNLARIPLTVFAFLGGALAIGIGFGTQTIIKNFICGILILLERNMKVGDTIDVDGVVGRIVTVDMRASTILGFDGVETVIPNSTFLENKVTNWTHTNAKLRRIVRVGVNYGSLTAQVRDILAECGNKHSLILNEPPAEVFFEDFAESSLVFALYFWIDYGPEVNPLQVASDLRFMIYQRFAEEGIGLAFPQRDLHLDSLQPLRIEVVPQSAAINNLNQADKAPG